MNITPIVERLEQQVTALKKVGGAVDFDRALATAAAYPAAFVVPLAESASENEFETEVVDQEVTSLFGVIVAVRNLNDAAGEAVQDALDPIRVAIREALLNWQPGEDFYGCTFAGGSLLGFKDQVMFWQDEYQTAFHIRNTGGNP